jgi:plasmid stabilization system protein ParE
VRRRPFDFTPEAKSDLKDILHDIAEDSPDTAERLRLEFYKGLEKLARSPGIGHYHEELLSRKYRFSS